MIKILHLYHDLMNLYGEYGNIEVLVRHLNDQGIKNKVDKKTIGDSFKFEDYDFIYCGSGLERNEMVALKDLMKRKASLTKAIKLNKCILFTGNAMELLGESIDETKALGIANIKTQMKQQRYSGDVVVDSAYFGELVGFINKCSLIENNDGLFTYIFKDEGIGDISKYEGYRINNLIGTHIIGPVLAKNPTLIRYYVEILGKVNSKKFIYKDIKYPYEEAAYNVTLNALKNRIK